MGLCKPEQEHSEMADFHDYQNLTGTSLSKYTASIKFL